MNLSQKPILLAARKNKDSIKLIMEFTINNVFNDCQATEDLGRLLDEIDELKNAEAWLTAKNGAAIYLLKAGENAILVYLRQAGDSGFHSAGKPDNQGTFQVALANGQLDEYPSSWCLELRRAYMALAYFFENDGERTPFIDWQED